MSFEILRVVRVDDYKFRDDDNNPEEAKVVHFEVRFREKRTLAQWWRREKAKEWTETVHYFTTSGHCWKDFPSLRDTDVMEWSRLTELYEQYTIKQSLEKVEDNG